MPLAEQIYGFPAWVVHRADLQSVLLKAVQKHGIPVYTGKRVRDIEFSNSTVVFEDGHRVKRDVILAGDGMSPAHKQYSGWWLHLFICFPQESNQLSDQRFWPFGM